jgi:uncharacterized protein (DUF952 family)
MDSQALEALPSIPNTTLCYRIVRKVEYDLLQIEKVYKGSELDIKDKYLHMSYASEVPGTLAKYYRGIPDVHVLVIDMTKLGFVPSSSSSAGSTSPSSESSNLRIEWVQSRHNYFPHLYNIPLPIEAIVDTIIIPLQPDGTFQFTDTVFG